LHVLKGRDLAAKDANGKSDPYVVFTWQGKTYKTPTIYKSLNPTWEKACFNLGEFNPTDSLEIQVWDKDRLSKDDFMGRVIIPLKDIAEVGNHEHWYPLEQREKKNEEVSGDILLRFETRLMGVVPPTFGVDLEALSKRESQDVPQFVTSIFEFLSACADEPQLFRTPVPADQLKGFKDTINAGGSITWLRDAPGRGPHQAAALFKLFLRELPVPLMTFDLTKKIVTAGRETEDSPSLPNKTKFIFAILPEAHMLLFLALLRLIQLLVHRDPAEAKPLAVALSHELMGPENEALQYPPIENFFSHVFANSEALVPKPIIQGMDDQSYFLSHSESTSTLLPGENAVTDLSVDSEAHKLFVNYDLNKSNTIDQHEFGIFYTEFVKSLGRKPPSARALRKIWSEVDVNGADEVSWEQFAQWWRSLQRPRSLSSSASGRTSQ
jgi:hypothetical protein